MRSIITNQDSVIGPWVGEKLGLETLPPNFASIGLEKDGKIIAGVIFEAYNGRTVNLHVAGIDNWCSRDYLCAVFHYAFEVLKVYKVLGTVSSANVKAMKLDLGLGFIHEATIAGAAKDGDLNILTMTREQCRWLRRR